MDFSKGIMERQGHGNYERMDLKLLPPLYLAYRSELGRISGVVLNDIRSRIAQIAAEEREALLEKNFQKLNSLIDENFDCRTSIMKISDGNRETIDAARRCGAAASFSGSGVTIIGMYSDYEMLTRIIVELRKLGARVIRPFIGHGYGEITYQWITEAETMASIPDETHLSDVSRHQVQAHGIL